MARSARQKATLAVAAAGILVLALAGLGYIRTVAKAERLDDRNLRELSRLARGVEGRVDNLPTLMRNLSRQTGRDARVRSAALIPHLSVDTLSGARGACGSAVDAPALGRTRFAIDLADASLRLCYPATAQDTVYAAYGLAAIAESLESDYFETVFLADTSGAVFLWSPDRPPVRVRELTAFDTLRSGVAARVPVSTIVQVQIAGRDYRFYLLPLRLHVGSAENDGTHSDWILGGLVRASSFRQESLSLGPAVALLLAVLALAGFLAAPFVRVFTMGPRERLGAGTLLYLIAALILASGLAGLGLADSAHFRQLRSELHERLDATADTIAAHIETEIDAALQELDALGEELQSSTRGQLELPFERGSAGLPLLMRTRLAPATGRAVYPNLQMALWADSTGWQVAKWTPRARNTPRVDISEREYFAAVQGGRGWPRRAETTPGNACTADSPAAEPAPRSDRSIFIESIRSWNTGEKLAAISSSFVWDSTSRAQPRGAHPGVGVIITRLASVDRPVMPPGYQVAVVDTAARTLFHSRPERILEEDFAEETDRPELLRSMLNARACRALDITYGGRPTRLAVRPLRDKPLFAIVLLEDAQLDTIRFEAWYIGAALFGALALLVLGCFVLLEASASTRIGWAWPDRARPARYVVLVGILLLFLLVLGLHALRPDRFPAHIATFFVPLQVLGLGLLVLARRDPLEPGREAAAGWATFGIASLLVAALVWAWRDAAPVPWLHVLVTALAPALVIAWVRRPAVNRMLEPPAAALPLGLLYTAAMTAGVVVIGVLPGYIAYQSAFLAHSELLVKYHQLEIDDALRARTQRLDSIMRADDRDPAYRELLEAQRFDQAFERLAFDTRRSVPAARLVPAGAAPWQGTVHRLLADGIPFLTDASVGMRQLSARDADRQWQRAADDSRPFQRIWLASDPPLEAALPPATGRQDAAWLLGLAAVLTGLATMVYWVSRRVFFIHIEHPEPLALGDVLPPAGGEWSPLILVGTRSISRAPIRARSDEVRIIDMRAARTAAGPTPQPRDLALPAGTDTPGTRPTTVCLDNFDHCFTESAWNLTLLDYLERLVYGDHPPAVLLLTSRDLESMLLATGDGVELSAGDRLRWARVLGRFTKVMLADLVSPEPLRAAIGLRMAEELIAAVEAVAEAPAGNGTSGDGPAGNGPAADVAVAARAAVPGAAAEPHRGDVDAALARLAWLDAELAELGGVADAAADEPSTTRLYALVERSRAVRRRLEASRARAAAGGAAGARSGARAIRRVERERKTFERVRATLLGECGHSARLQQIGRQILARPRWYALSRGELLDLIREGADSYYAALWAILSDQERLVAAQLAAGAVVNPRSHQAVTRLFARGLIARRPELRLKNESFGRFVRETVPGDVLTSWERADTPSTWEIVRAPLLLGWIGVALFLFWAQRDMLGNAIAFLSTAGVGLAAILRVLTMFERPGAAPSREPG